ncbi:MAG TPA: type II secretion system F family protein [Mycobacteriales bacterium]|nr:type II secretion system F family protein [Mycobacteriales bacterium]
MVIAFAASAIAIAAGLTVRPPPAPSRRLSGLSIDAANPAAATDQPSPRRAATRLTRRRRIAAAIVALIAAVAVLGPVLGVVAGGVLAVVMVRFGGGSADLEVDGGAVALVADLVAAALAGGTLLSEAVAAAAEGVEDEVLRQRCRAVAAALGAGASPDQAWAPWLADARLAPIARTAIRTSHSGAATADELRRTASRLRAQRRTGLQQRVRQASVWVVVPLGLCFLPAFVLVAVVPLVIGLLPVLR